MCGWQYTKIALDAAYLVKSMPCDGNHSFLGALSLPGQLNVRYNTYSSTPTSTQVS
jgi:hypothetical protein